MHFPLRALLVAALLSTANLHAQPMPRATVAGASPSFVVDDDYLMFGDAQVAPTNVFASGGRTYLQLTSIRGALPSVFAVTPTGYVPIKPTFDPPYLAFEGLEQEFVLMYPGRKFVVIRHGSFTGDAPQDLPQVLFSHSRDGLKFASDEILGKARAASTQLQRERVRVDRDRQTAQEVLAMAETSKAQAGDLQAKTLDTMAATRRSVEATLKDYEHERAAAASRLVALEQKMATAETSVQQAVSRAAEAERVRAATERQVAQELLRKAEAAKSQATDMQLKAIDTAATTRRALEAAQRDYEQERAASAKRFAALEQKVSAAVKAAQHAVSKAGEAEVARLAGERQTALDLLRTAEAAKAEASAMQSRALKEFDQERTVSGQRMVALEQKVAIAEKALQQAEARAAAEEAVAQVQREAAEELRRKNEQSQRESAAQQEKVLREMAEVRAESTQRISALEEKLAAEIAAPRQATQIPPQPTQALPAAAVKAQALPARWSIHRSDSTIKQAVERWARESGAPFRWAMQDEIDVNGEGATEAVSFAEAVGQLAASLRRKGYSAFAKDIEGYVVLTEKP